MTLIQDEIRKLRNEISSRQEKLDKLMDRQSAMTPERLRAEALHEVLCHHNHMDGCDWYYGLDDFSGSCHSKYLKHSNFLFNVVDKNQKTYDQIIGALRGI